MWYLDQQSKDRRIHLYKEKSSNRTYNQEMGHGSQFLKNKLTTLLVYTEIFENLFDLNTCRPMYNDNLICTL